MRDSEGKAILRHWPDTTSLFNLPGGKKFIKAFPPSPIASLVTFGTTGPFTEPDGAYISIIPPLSPYDLPSVDALFIEVCGSGLTNLRDKKSRYQPTFESKGIEFTPAWFSKILKQPGNPAGIEAWAALGLKSLPTSRLRALFRIIRVLYVVPDGLLNSITTYEVPKGYEYFTSDTRFRSTVSGWPTGAAVPASWAPYTNPAPAFTNAVTRAKFKNVFNVNQHFV
jgi:hypothetical protein